MKHAFLAKSSSGNPYDVTFEVIGGRMVVRCTCKAGELNQQCKHKRALSTGDAEMLMDKSQTQALKDLMAMPVASDLMDRLRIEEEALAMLETEKSRLAAQEKAIKRRIADIFTGKA